jgi:hypothetical protein
MTSFRYKIVDGRGCLYGIDLMQLANGKLEQNFARHIVEERKITIFTVILGKSDEAQVP